ncbi:MAG: ribosome hibernation-promoting factor, HPF/YfiA family [Bacilli bacterium]
MKYTYVGKSYVVSDPIKEYAEKKYGKLEGILPASTNVKVTFSVTKLEQKVEATINLDKRTIRSEVKDNDMYAAIDKSSDILEAQIIKYKSRIKTKSKKEARYKEEYEANFDDLTFDADVDMPQIIKSKKFAIKPMDAEEAAMELELLGHGFYVFKNSNSDEVNVIYKRVDGDYGLIEPEF